MSFSSKEREERHPGTGWRFETLLMVAEVNGWIRVLFGVPYMESGRCQSGCGTVMRNIGF